MGNFAIDLIVSPQVAQQTLPYEVAVKGVVSGFLAPLALPEPWFRLLVPRVFDGFNAGSEDVLGKMPICGQINDRTGVKVAVGVGSSQVICAVVHDPVSVIELIF